MEGDKPESQSKHEDSQISPKIVAANVEGFQHRVKEVLKTTTEEYDKRIAYLTTNLTDLSSMHTALADQHRLLIEKVIRDELDVKEDNEALLIKYLNLEQEVVSLNEKIVSLEGEITQLKVDNNQERELDVHGSRSESSPEVTGSAQLDWANNYITELTQNLETEKWKVRRLENHRNELILLVNDTSYRVKSMEEELEASKKKLVVSRKLIASLKKDQGQADQNVLDSLLEKIDSYSKTIHELQERIINEVSVRENQATEFNTKIDEYKCVITEMEVMNRLKEDIWNDDVGKLKVEVQKKSKSFDDLIQRLNALKLEKKSISPQLNTLQEENCSKDDLIQELETRLDSLQVEHVGVRSLIDDVDKVNNEITKKVAELRERLAGSEKLFQKAKM